MHNISLGSFLSFGTIRYIEIYYKKLKFVKTRHTNTYRSYMLPFAVKRNVDKYKNAALSHNCIKLTVIPMVL